MPIDAYAKAIASLFSAGAIWIANATPISGIPAWITELGLPVAFLMSVIYALIQVHRALRDSEKGRRDDWMRFSDKLESMVEHGRESRERLITASHEQTAEFRRLADKLEGRTCMVQHLNIPKPPQQNVP